MTLIIGLLIFIYAVILHEMAHGLVAERLGDPTARLSKRLTLNPISHLDPLMSVLLPLLLIISGSPIIFGAAKPVPVDPYNLRDPKRDMGLIGLAGPMANILLAVLLAVIVRLLGAFLPFSVLIPSLIFGAKISLFLAIFNLIPLPPLDGGRVLVALLPEQYADTVASLERYGLFILIFFLLFPNPFFSLPAFISRITNLLLGLLFPVWSATV